MILTDINAKHTPFLLLDERLCAKKCHLLNLANLISTEKKFNSSLMHKEHNVSSSGESDLFSKDYKELMPKLNKALTHTIQSPFVGETISKKITDMVVGFSGSDFLVQLVRCSHIDWHSDMDVAHEYNTHEGIYLICLSDNPLNMCLRSRSGDQHVLRKGDIVFFNDHIEHSLLPEKTINVCHNELNNNPLSFVTLQRTKTSTELELFFD